MNTDTCGLYLKSSLCRLPLRFRAAIACISCDVPAARKICGFKSHNSHRGCSKCFKLFPGNVKDSFDFSGFKREEWPNRDIRSHRQHARELLRAKTKAEHDRLAKKYGLYYSVLLELSYFDCIRFTVIDPDAQLIPRNSQINVQAVDGTRPLKEAGHQDSREAY